MRGIWIYILAVSSLAISCNRAPQNNLSSISVKEKQAQTGLNIGDRAPNIKADNPEGENIALENLKGKIVLIDFWASWCPPCRLENPYLADNYQKFKNKNFKKGIGFTVFSVSLDKNKNEWVTAIESDDLLWPNHVSDLKGWMSVPAAMYQVQAIPSNFLIDGEGIILAKNIKGKALNNILSELITD